MAAGVLGAEPLDWRLVDVALLGADATSPGFTRVTDVAFGAHGDVLVLDGAAPEVVLFDVTSGELTRRFGRRGQGPGEFDGPSLIDVAPNGEVFVFDSRADNRISRFAGDGGFIDSSSAPFASMSGATRNMGAAQAGTFLLRVPSRVAFAERTALRHPRLLLLEAGAREPHSVFEWPDLVVEPVDLGNPGAGITMYENPQPLWALLPGGRHAVGRRDRYEIDILDAQGAVLGALRRDIDPQRVTDELKERFLAQLPAGLRDREVEWGEYLPVITNVFPGVAGGVLVMRGRNGSPVIDIFSAEFEFLAQVDLPKGFLMMAARDGLIAGKVETAEFEGAVRVMRLER